MSYLANKQNTANLTSVYYWDGGGGAWSGNLIGAGLPQALLALAPAADDFILFGIDVASPDAGPFCSLVFDLMTAQNDLTIVWRYSDTGGPRTADPTDIAGGGANPWPLLALQDNTDQDGAMTGNPFDTTGIKSVHWRQNFNWDACDPQVNIPVGPLLGTTALWICAHVTNIGATPTPPVQQHRNIYTITWAYVEIAQADAPLGDVPALARVTARNQSHGATVTTRAADIRMGVRSLSRGSDFSAYLNAANIQNPVGVTATVDGITTNFNARISSPTGIAALSAAIPAPGLS